MISRQTIVLGVAALAALGGIAASAAAQTSSGPVAADATVFSSQSRFGEQDGASLYANVCAACHMPDGKGARGAGFYPSLEKSERLAASGYPAYVVLKGMNGMPAVGSMMSDEQVAEVVNYVRTNFGNTYTDPITAEEVKAIR
ncbi:MAG: hypothetical protein B7Z08_08115 [Sphingomonadales bacterium 32-68-7]|nr:MAG: hypothetical protein B7Z33_10235 [Sphingomonadales bacterium 12-68-11]OYX08739.1 MAG: hypothetical protein B7Z08_08115 [Sphingomonadales bacterium 32-68-7]